jgi:hypothetical protein
VRRRHYFELVRAFLVERPDALFLNIAAGFTSYPFLLDPGCGCVETDYAHITAYKERRVAELIAAGELPKRQVAFHALDLENLRLPTALARFEAQLATWTASGPAWARARRKPSS